MKVDLEGKTTVVSGGAGGIGRQIAYAFAENGSDISILDIDKKSGQEAAGDISKKYGVGTLFSHCDIADFERVKSACRKIIDRFGKVDNIVLAAGYGSRAAMEEMDLSEWKRSVDININGPFYIIRAFIDDLLKSGKANIILIGSATYYTGSGGGVHYSTTKVAQYGLMKGLAYEYLPRGIRTNIITPHIIDTPMLRKRYPDTEENNKILAARLPIGRFGKPQDIASAALFLASDDSGYICGTEIVADGGGVYYRH
jgi:3-oxoacyl-[acyl-carrier protein] reductase